MPIARVIRDGAANGFAGAWPYRAQCGWIGLPGQIFHWLTQALRKLELIIQFEGAPEAVAGRVCSSQFRGALLRNRIVGLAFTQRLQRVEYTRDVDRLLKQSALNGHDIAERCGDHAEQ